MAGFGSALTWGGHSWEGRSHDRRSIRVSRGEINSVTTSLVNRESGTRWASRLAVELDVGELGVLQWSCVRSREAILRVIYFLATRVLWLACGVHLIGTSRYSGYSIWLGNKVLAWHQLLVVIFSSEWELML